MFRDVKIKTLEIFIVDRLHNTVNSVGDKKCPTPIAIKLCVTRLQPF